MLVVFFPLSTCFWPFLYSQSYHETGNNDEICVYASVNSSRGILQSQNALFAPGNFLKIHFKVLILSDIGIKFGQNGNNNKSSACLLLLLLFFEIFLSLSLCVEISMTTRVSTLCHFNLNLHPFGEGAESWCCLHYIPTFEYVYVSWRNAAFVTKHAVEPFGLAAAEAALSSGP